MTENSKRSGVMIGDVVIVRQPVSVCVPKNYEVVLSLRAEGSGVLSYQWFTTTEQEVPGATQPDLRVAPSETCLYVCRVHDQFFNCAISDWIRVKVLDVAPSGLPQAWQGEPCVALHPVSQQVPEGRSLTLRCAAFAVPAPQYQWYRNGLLLEGGSTGTLQVDCTAAEHAGWYLCSVSNVLGETWTKAANVDIVAADKLPLRTPTATDKVALLIGNLNYAHHPGLMAPTMDVHELANLLRQLGFRVVSLLDLSRDQMQAAIDEFTQLLDRGVYGLFYYAGHGYERSGRNYLVAVDAPQPYRPQDCVCVQRVMHGMQHRCSALSVVLLDTCRKWYNQNCNQSEILPLEPSGNTVYGYATCEDAEAFEMQDGGKSTGIFTKYLNKHILKPERVTHVLEKVSEDLGRDPLVTGKQAVEIKHTLKEPRSLTDPVRTSGHTRELRLRDACWKQANKLPRKMRLLFRCGVEVEVSFSALFSNVMVVFGAVRTPGARAEDCTLTLRSSPAMEDIFSGPGRSEEIDSLILSKSENADCTLRLCALQKLQGSLLIEVELHYTHLESRQRLKESRQLDVGKPLVASCKLDRSRPAGPARGRREPPARSLGNLPSGKTPGQRVADAPCRPSTRKAEVKAAHGNEPEENDETEMWGSGALTSSPGP